MRYLGWWMACDPSVVEELVLRAGGAGAVSARKLFGEYALYLDEKLVGLVCGDVLFVKATAEGRAFIGDVSEASPYPGAELVRITADALPLPKPKKRRFDA